MTSTTGTLKTGPLTGRTALVTGTTSGFGAAIATRLAGAGAYVVATGRSHDKLTAITAELGDRGEPAVLDVRDTDAFEALIERTAGRGDFSILVNNAGLRFYDPTLDGPLDRDRGVIETIFVAALASSRAAVRAFRKYGTGGNIVNISSTSSRMPPFGVYGAMKSAINVLNADLRSELENEPIRVSGILPGAANTGLARELSPEFAAAVGQIMEANPGISFSLDPDDIARAVEFIVTRPLTVSIDELVISPQANIMSRLS